MISSGEVIRQTKKWIQEVVIGCNFCQFAAQVVKQRKVFYQVETGNSVHQSLTVLLKEAIRLDEDPDIETSFLIFPNAFQQFEQYLDMLSLAEHMLKKKRYEGIYQLASFHPLYRFDLSHEEDAANYTNRSPYPMLHLLREKSIDTALANYTNPGAIPERNIHFARGKGLTYLQMLRDSCLKE